MGELCLVPDPGRIRSVQDLLPLGLAIAHSGTATRTLLPTAVLGHVLGEQQVADSLGNTFGVELPILNHEKAC